MIDKRFLFSVLFVSIGLGIWADNKIELSSGSGKWGEEVTISVSLSNADAISSIQITIPLEDGLEPVSGSGKVGNRCANHTLVMGMKEGSLQIVAYSQAMTAISGSSGKIVSFKLKLCNEPKEFYLNPSEVKLTDINGASVSSTIEGGTITTLGAKMRFQFKEINFGKVGIGQTGRGYLFIENTGNENLVVTGADFSETDNFSMTTSLPLTVAPGASTIMNVDFIPQNRVNIEETLTVVSNSIPSLNTVTLKAQSYAINELRLVGASGSVDEEVTVSLTMNNMDDITGFQVDLKMPNELEFVEGSFSLSNRKAGHVGAALLNNGVLHILAYSLENSAFKSNTGEICSFKVKLVGAKRGYLVPINTVLTAFVDGVLQNVVSESYSTNITINCPILFTSQSLDLGEASTKISCEKTLTIYNTGNAPLIISQVSFDDENLSIKESLPLTIESTDSHSQTITVVYKGKEPKTISANMLIYSNDPEQRVFTTKITGKVYAPNYLSFSVSDVYSSTDEVPLDITMDNDNDISGIQFDIISSDHYTVDISKIMLDDRAYGMDIEVWQIDDNTLRLMGYVKENGIVSGNGKLMTIYLNPAEELAEGNHLLTMNRIIMGDLSLINIYSGEAEQNLSYEMRTYILGDANGDQTVNVNDVVTTVDRILERETSSFVFEAADVNKDDVINVSDVVGIVDIILGRYVASNARQREGGTAADNDCLQLVRNSDETISLCLDNQNQYVAAQFDVRMAEGQVLKAIRLNSSRKNGHQVSYAKVGDNCYRVLVYSMGNQAFNGQQGELVSIETSGSSALVAVENILFTTKRMTTVEFAPLQSTATSIETISQMPAADIYTMDGRLVRKQATSTKGLNKGIYIINNQKTIVK